MHKHIQYHWIAKESGGRKLKITVPKEPTYSPTLEKIVLEGRQKNLSIMKKYASLSV